MKKNQYSHLENRGKDRLEIIFQNKKSPTLNHLFFTSGYDLGVCRNGGRRGASFAPKAILAVLKKMALHPHFKSESARIEPINIVEEEDFEKFQQRQTEFISSKIKESPKTSIIHLGGGHDHIYSLLCALNFHKKITVLNIDAHLDTRVDSTSHSGTPFRQFSKEVKGEFNLIQLGIHQYSNAESNYQKLKKGNMKIISSSELAKASLGGNLSKLLTDHIPLQSDALTVLSLDCDGLSCSYMEGVSAVNPHGLSMQTVSDIFTYYKNGINHPPIVGIYEYNPLYDNLSQKGARVISTLLYNLLF